MEEEQRILDIKVRYEDAINGILKYQKALNDLNAAQKELKKQTGLSAEQQREVDQQMEANQAAITQYKDNIRVLRKELQNNLKQEKEQEGSLKSLRAELSNATKAYDELSRMERESAKGKEMQKHINEITDELKKAEEETQRFYRNVGNYEGAINNAIFGNSKFGQSLEGLNKLLDEGGVSGAMAKAKTATSGFLQTLLGMIKNPYFLALSGVAGAGAAFKWFWDYNTNIGEATRLTQQFTGLAGDDLKAVRNEVQALADSYGHDFQELLEAANSMAKGFGISVQESLTIIQNGFVAGADASGEFLDTVREYPAYFKEAGISAEAFVAITTQATKQGVFSDKGVDTIKEANLRLREMTTSTASALDGIGISSKKVQEELQNGSKTTFDIMQEVGAKLKEFPQTSAEVGTAIADIFGGPGEDAGLAYIESLATIKTNLEDVKGQAGDLAKANEEQIEAQKELQNTISALFDMSDKGFGTMKVHMRTIATKFLTSIMKGLINVINYFIDWYNESLVVRYAIQGIATGFQNAWATIKLVFNLIIDAVKSVGRQMKGLADIIEGVVTFSWAKIKAGFTEITSNFGKTFKEGLGDIKSFGYEVADNFMDGLNKTLSKAKVAHIEVPVMSNDPGMAESGDPGGTSSGEGKTTGATPKGGSTTKSGKNNTTSKVEDITKKEQDELRKAEDLLNQLIEDSAERQRANIRATYDRQIQDLQNRLDSEKNLTVSMRQSISVQIQALQQIENNKLSELDSKALQDRIKQENDYYDELLKSVEKGSETEYQLALRKLANQQQLEIDAVEQSKLTEEQKQQQILAIQAAYEKQYEEAEKAHGEAVVKAQVDAAKKALEERTAETMNDYYEGEATEDPEITKLRLQLEIRKQILDEAQQTEGESLQEFNQRRLGYENDYYEAKQALSQKEIEVEKGKWDAINGMVGGAQQVAEAFGESSTAMAKASKVLSLAQIAISSGVALAEGVKQAQSVPFPANIAAIATTVTTILANIATAVKTVKSAKFASGGDVVGEGTGTSDSVSAKLSNGESVLTAAATSMFAPALSAFNQIGGGVPILGGNNNQQVGEEYLANAVARGMAMAPRPVVSVEEISQVKSRVETIEQIGSV